MSRSGPVERGFSYIELVAVGALLTILLLAVLPRFFAPAELDVELEVRKVASDLAMARRIAIAGRASYVVTFTPAGGPYTTYTVARQGGADEPDFPKTFPSGMTVSGIDQVIFGPSGSATPAGAPTWSFSGGGASASVEVLTATGRVRVIGP